MEKQTYRATLRLPNSVNDGLIQIAGENVIGLFTLDYLVGCFMEGYLHFDYYANIPFVGLGYYGRFKVCIKELEIGLNYIFATKDEYNSFFTIDEIVYDEDTIKFLEEHIKFGGK